MFRFHNLISSLTLLTLIGCASAAPEPTLLTESTDIPLATDQPITSTSIPQPTITASEQVSIPSEEPTPMPEPTDNPAPATEADANVTFVKAIKQSNGSWTFYVSVNHPDTGWEDYADGWDVVLPDGTVIKPDSSSPFTRLLLHPHVGEQPFTRSQSGIIIPDGVTSVTVRAHDLVTGFGGVEIVVDLTVSEGEGFAVEGS